MCLYMFITVCMAVDNHLPTVQWIAGNGLSDIFDFLIVFVRVVPRVVVAKRGSDRGRLHAYVTG